MGDDVLDQFVAESKRLQLPLASVCLNILHRNYLKSDPLGPRRVADAIGMAKRVGVQVILLPFFGPGALKTPAEMDFVGDALKELGPDAQKAGIILGLEDTISAKDNVRIMERSQSPAVLTYYDVGNSTQNGFNVVEEIRWLGKDRICEMHLKDNPHYLGEGQDQLPRRHRRDDGDRVRQVGGARDRRPEGAQERHAPESRVHQGTSRRRLNEAD